MRPKDKCYNCGEEAKMHKDRYASSNNLNDFSLDFFCSKNCQDLFQYFIISKIGPF